MKINETQRLSSVNAYRAGVQAKEKAAAGGKVQKDDVHISPEAKELLEAQQSNQSGRIAQIESLKASVQAGTYHVNAEKIAEKLLPFFK